MMYTEGQQHHKTSSGSGTSQQTVPSSNIAHAGIEQGMTTMSLTQSPKPQPQQMSHHKTSPPSPRALNLKQMMNNDEEDWQKVSIISKQANRK